MKRKLAGSMALMMLISALFAGNVFAQETPARETCRTMTEKWFGSVQSQGALDPDTIQKWAPVLDAYAEKREEGFHSESVAERTYYCGAEGFAPLDTDSVSEQEQRRRSCIEAMEERMHILVTDADVTVALKGVSEKDGQVILDLYEWIFFDYVDLDGNAGMQDVSGYGLDHRLILQKTASGYQVVSDIYEDDLTEMNTGVSQEETAEIPLFEQPKQAGSQSRTANYDRNKAAAYADRYVKKDISQGIDASSYNPAYKNFNDMGGDCTNYVSQCIYAGGIAMDDTWFYKNEENYSGEWSTSRRNFTYMSKLGKVIKNPGNSDVLKGNPVYYTSGDNIVHTTICVGTNASGVPVVDSHNKDYYHVKWNYWGSNTTYYTIQLGTGGGNVSVAPVRRPVISGQLPGDVDDDQKITAMDALEVLKMTVKYYILTDIDIRTADVDGDGKVTAKDALLVLQRVTKQTYAFPVDRQ